jgi:hypothetical protein
MSNYDPPDQSNVDGCREILDRHAGAGDASAKRVALALARIGESGGVDGAHHKAWTLDQVVRILAGPAYDEWVRWKKDGEDGPESYGWDEGIPP